MAFPIPDLRYQSYIAPFPTTAVVYFFAAADSSAAALALFSRTPTRRASERASRSFLYAFSSPLKLPMGPSVTLTTFLIGRTSLTDETAFFLTALTSSAEASPLVTLPLRRGKRMRRFLYSWRRSTLALRDSSERFWRRGSTEIPIVGASLRGMPAA